MEKVTDDETQKRKRMNNANKYTSGVFWAAVLAVLLVFVSVFLSYSISFYSCTKGYIATRKVFIKPINNIGKYSRAKLQTVRPKGKERFSQISVEENKESKQSCNKTVSFDSIRAVSCGWAEVVPAKMLILEFLLKAFSFTDSLSLNDSTQPFL